MGIVVALLIILIVWLLFGSRISAWISNRFHTFVANKTEDMLRKAMGMPPRPDSREGKRRQKRGAYAGSGEGEPDSARRRRRRSSRADSGPIIPKEYAEDVEFVEFKEFSSTTEETADGGSVRFRRESQVSDVEFVEIKNK